MTKKSVGIFLEMGSLDWHRAATSIRAQEEAAGNEVKVFDLTDIAWPHFGRFRMPRVTSQAVFKESYSLDSDIEASKSIESLKLSILRGAERGLLAHLVHRELLKSARLIFQSIEPIAEQLDRAYLPNGRFPLARLARLLFQHDELRYYEIAPEGDSRFIVTDYPIHDRIARQADFLKSSMTEAKVREISDSWLLPRTSATSRTNAFAGLWDDTLTVTSHDNVFFTSSTDEYWALGEQWHEDEWEDQYEAFDAILTCLEARGERDSALRIHPNLLNKSVRYVSRELERIRWISTRHPDLVVIYPQEPVNSYRLVEGAKRVVVSMSTIGLEASAAGKPVWATSANSYDLIADIRRVLRPGDLAIETLDIWTVSDMGARRYIASNESSYRRSSTSSDADLRKLSTFQLATSAGPVFIALRALAKIQRVVNLVNARISSRLYR